MESCGMYAVGHMGRGRGEGMTKTSRLKASVVC